MVNLSPTFTNFNVLFNNLTIFINFTKAFDSIHGGKMEQILLVYGIPKETIAAIMILYKNTGEKAWQQLHKNAVSNFEQVLEATPHKATAVRPPTSHHKLSKTNQTCRTLLEKWGRAHTPLHGQARAGRPALHTAALWGYRM